MVKTDIGGLAVLFDSIVDVEKFRAAADRVRACVAELNKSNFSYRASDFEPTKIAVVFERVQEVNGVIDRVLTLMTEFERAKYEIVSMYKEANMKYESVFFQHLGAPDFLIAKAYAYQERHAHAYLKVFELKKILVKLENIALEFMPGIELQLKRKLDFLKSVKWDMFSTINALKAGSVTIMERDK